ncbi:MAG: hypothetical protein EOP90_05080 [Lysobacteraceae bacterium]|nr:MAG: hypothetical protein EOP90_05080 [Xanthomonadaceae bacterium]
MKRRTRTTLWLLATLVALVAAVQWQVRHERARLADPLSALELDAVRRIEVGCRGCEPRRYEKIDGLWRMLAPHPRAADAQAIARLLAIAHAPVRTRYASGELDPARIGLVPPLATLRLDDAVFTFGTTDAIHGDRYVAIGDRVALVPDRFSVHLFAAPETSDTPAAGDGSANAEPAAR